ncbi:hypothetical protein CEXT_568541 [Caerostris extrusa]|uniref:Uncharacterized protein n=1 Tax=Caerostris extrusa TaxID=172846 RepID=A0AAV4YC07_CAEEX|nr:hypothetical protein CEXT_568541 [Caerostris extrusa]
MPPLVILPPSPSLPLQIRLMNNLEAIRPEKSQRRKANHFPDKVFPVSSPLLSSHREGWASVLIRRQSSTPFSKGSPE